MAKEILAKEGFGYFYKVIFSTMHLMTAGNAHDVVSALCVDKSKSNLDEGGPMQVAKGIIAKKGFGAMNKAKLVLKATSD